MAHIQDRWQTKDGKRTSRWGTGDRYRVRYIVDGAERDGGSYPNGQKAAAQRQLSNIEADISRGVWVDPTNTITLSQYAREWAKIQKHNDRTRARVESQLKIHVHALPLGARPLVKLTASDVQRWATDRSRALATSTWQNLVNLVSSILSAAVDDKIIGSSPVTKRLRAQLGLVDDTERVVPLTVDQVRKLAAAMDERFRAAVYAQAGLGLRVGELLALRAESVVLLSKKPLVHVTHQIAPRTLELVAPKTRYSIRDVPMPEMVGFALSRLTPGPQGLYWYTSTNRPINHDYYRIKFTAAVRKAELPEGTTPHDLRHHYASVLLAAGESVIAVAERLGHKDASLVISTYGHLLPDREDWTRKAIDGAWGELPEPSMITARRRPRSGS